MNLCGDKTVSEGEREGTGDGSPPGRTSVGGRKWRSGTKKHSYATISNGAYVQIGPCPRLECHHLIIQTHLTYQWTGQQQQQQQSEIESIV